MASYSTAYPLLASVLLLASCSSEEITAPEKSTRGRIEFKASLPVVASRAIETTAPDIEVMTVSAFTGAHDSETTYFLGKDFTRNATTGSFFSFDPECIWPNNNDVIRFVAFAPTCSEMRLAGGFSDTDFTFSESVTGVTLTGDYKLSSMKIAADIADQFDFVTAIGTGNLLDNEETPVNLNLKHQLSRIEFQAYGASSSFNIEIAGVRLGGVGVEGEFSFVSSPDATADDASQAGQWTSVSKGSVEYIYRAGDKIVLLDKTAGSHSTAADAVSILGSRIGEGEKAYDNSAMIIPSENSAWDYKDNADNGENHADGMYVSVLMRVTDTTPYAPDDPVVYPYPGNEEGMEVIHLAVDNQGSVISRLYLNEGRYFTDPDFTSEYTPEAESVSVKTFGWASLPVAGSWNPGYVYTYTLNYTGGVGLRDPRDPKPGTPIISDKVIINVDMTPWKTGSNSNVTVPRR